MTTSADDEQGPNWLTQQELADRLKISVRHLSRLRTDGFPHIRLGASIRYDATEVERYLHEKRCLPPPVSGPQEKGGHA
jgi:excisionase family DNA binding protein